MQQVFQLALQHHQARQFAEAEALYQRILADDDHQAEALHMLGLLAHQTGRHRIAGEYIERAVALMPDNAGCYANLSDVLRVQKRFDEAVAAAQRALELQPGFANAHNNLGNVLSDMGRLDEAAAAYRRTVGLTPGDAEVHANLGNVLRIMGHREEALQAFQKVVDLQPDSAAAHLGLGSALRDQGRLEAAIAEFQRAVQLQPASAEAHNSLGAALRALGRTGPAIAVGRRATQLQPDFAEAFNNLANALRDQGRLEEACAAYRRAFQLQPALTVAHSNLLLCLHYLPEGDAQSLFDEHCRWNEDHARPLARHIAAHDHERDTERQLRVGYVSPDFREHSVAFFLESLLAGHSGEKVEVFCYADVPRADAVTARLRRLVPHWRDIHRVPDAEVAGQIREDAIDILVDLAGHTARHRLAVFARKPAPIQVTWLGYCNTTGMTAMDYRFTDAQADPAGTTEQFHTEQLIRLPETFACYRPVDDAPAVGPTPALSRGHVTFASFHLAAKLNEPLLKCWVEILQKVPNAKLLLAGAGLDEEEVRQRLRGFFTGHGIDSGRLEFRSPQPMAGYLAQHRDVDVLLDSHPFNGHTVCCHALWMGVPVVTRAGAAHRSRMVASVLTNIGLPELIARTAEEYVQLACDLATDLSRLAALRSTLRERMAASPLTDGPRFARNVEQAYREMWRTLSRPPGSRTEREIFYP